MYGNTAIYSNGQLNPYTSKNRLNSRYDSKNNEREVQKNYSLKSFKSIGDINQSQDCFVQEYHSHFNSGASVIKLEGPAATEPTTIKVIHKPYTHLDNSRIQKCFKIYNEFVQLVFKNRLQIVQNAENFQQNELQKGDITKIYKLANHMGVKLPKRTNSSALGRQPLIETLKNHRQLQLIKEQIVRFVHRLLNEENGISQAFATAVLLGAPFQSSNAQANQSPQKQDQQTQSAAKDAAQGGEPASLGGLRSSLLSQNQLVLRQLTTFYKYQVGLGNNHLLIKSIMKMRLWWHQIQREKVNTSVVRLDFDEAQIMWTQWRKVRLYYHLATKDQFQEEFKDLLKALDEGRIQIVLNTGGNQLNSDGLVKAMDKFKEKQANMLAEKTARNGQHLSSISPRPTDPKEAAKLQGVNPQKFKNQNIQNQKAKSNQKGNGRAPTSDYAGAETTENAKDKHGSPAPKHKAQHKNQYSRQSSSSRKHRNQNDSENDADKEDDEDPSDEEFKKTSQSVKKGKKTHLAQLPQLSNQELQAQLDKCKRQFQKVYNRLEFNQHLNNKKALFLNMRNYYTYCCEKENVFDTLPLTFHIKHGHSDPEYLKFEEYY